ncbi:MAG: ABC transporter permease subunit [Candidatus Nucleicultricaceae bacterium]
MKFARSRALFTFMAFGYAFLYAPIVLLVAYSFNESKSSSVWTGFSLKWYKALLSNQNVLDAAWLSLKIAFMTANLAVTIGTIGALVIVRFKTFKGKSFLNGLVTAPLVMPDVMTGLALLLMFVVLGQLIGWPAERGMITIMLGHCTIAIAYVLVVIRARLVDFDIHLEEAALDLGARPMTVFFRITLPIIFPSIAAAWLLAFTLSLDDVIIADFLSGPGSTTLPMLVFSSIRLGVSPEINALATIIVSVLSIGIIVAGVVMNRRLKMQKRS